MHNFSCSSWTTLSSGVAKKSWQEIFATPKASSFWALFRVFGPNSGQPRGPRRHHHDDWTTARAQGIYRSDSANSAKGDPEKLISNESLRTVQNWESTFFKSSDPLHHWCHLRLTLTVSSHRFLFLDSQARHFKQWSGRKSLCRATQRELSESEPLILKLGLLCCCRDQGCS